MRLSKIITFVLAVACSFLSLGFTSCGTLPEKKKQIGPVSSESAIPWNRRLPGEGQGGLGGFSR